MNQAHPIREKVVFSLKLLYLKTDISVLNSPAQRVNNAPRHSKSMFAQFWPIFTPSPLFGFHIGKIVIFIGDIPQSEHTF